MSMRFWSPSRNVHPCLSRDDPTQVENQARRRLTGAKCGATACGEVIAVRLTSSPAERDGSSDLTDRTSPPPVSFLGTDVKGKETPQRATLFHDNRDGTLTNGTEPPRDSRRRALKLSILRRPSHETRVRCIESSSTVETG